VAFWGLTPRLYMIHMQGARERAQAQAQVFRVLAYNTAALTRTKKMPSPRDFIGGRENKLRGRAALDQLRAYAARLPKRSWAEWQRHSSAR
jgi:hypothetical protein